MSTIPNGKYVEPRQTVLVPWSSFWYAHHGAKKNRGVQRCGHASRRRTPPSLHVACSRVKEFPR